MVVVSNLEESHLQHLQPVSYTHLEEALAQIEAKHYVDAFKMSGKKVVKIGLNFSVKDEVNCLEWKLG